MLRRYLFEIVLTALILCGLIAVFFTCSLPHRRREIIEKSIIAHPHGC
ncbi:hypothetical protein M5585_15685 [Serratia ureilytica]